ncbi:MAG: DUF5710 domain-containing protein [Methyloprofundus sp.]|nr:DUF5710 domain-containing protein [Methyloprofundus sp.]
MTTKNYLNVPYAEKDAAKALGARWDPAKKKWYAPEGAVLDEFSQWILDTGVARVSVKPVAAKKALQNIITQAADKDFVAYSGEQPPWG